MGRGIRVVWVVCLLGGGCATAPPIDNPMLAGPRTSGIENPVLVSPGVPTQEAYQEVFEKVVDIVGDYFDLDRPNPIAGTIVTKPRIAPGYEQFLETRGIQTHGDGCWQRSKPYARLHRLPLHLVSEGGFWCQVVVDRELEDLARPCQARIGNAVFQENPTVARPFDVVNQDLSTEASQTWFKVGRDYALEQLILSRIRNGR